MTEAQSAEQLRLLQQEIVLAGEAIETLKRDQRAAIAALRLEVEVLKRCLLQVHPELAAQFEAIRATLIRVFPTHFGERRALSEGYSHSCHIL
jgi:hypothetical protein